MGALRANELMPERIFSHTHSILIMAFKLSDLWRLAALRRSSASLARTWLAAALPLIAAAFALLCMPQAAHAQFSFPREQTKLDLTIAAAEDVNPDDKGRAAPIMVRVYELKSPGTFESADFFTLNANDKSVIGADMLVRDEFILRPGDTKTIRRKSHPDLAAVGILAGYRDLAHAEWRVVQKLDPAPEAAWYRMVMPANKAKLRIDLQAKGIQVTPIE
ncbi:type VI secretion system lipoprotein TssJ [Variovorax sp. J22R133]|uniref:type VI secretion system lipoprotein TssJ n=1 Tax=Variovorax brevis TaxID=3053503 RepID=UPI00257605E3|nr:type VI secretion system lipoprotein TssJ [Variovorax sp. J22R133]MDM0112096.1 type VI secretion system lipoprotein TssJ [Variovorax sp. J22R133]